MFSFNGERTAISIPLLRSGQDPTLMTSFNVDYVLKSYFLLSQIIKCFGGTLSGPSGRLLFPSPTTLSLSLIALCLCPLSTLAPSAWFRPSFTFTRVEAFSRAFPHTISVSLQVSHAGLNRVSVLCKISVLFLLPKPSALLSPQWELVFLS